MTKQRVVGGMRVRTYEVLARAVEEGVRLGWRHAHKHTEQPNTSTLQDSVYEAVMNAICEVFEFPAVDSLDP